MFQSIIDFMADIFNYFYIFIHDSIGISDKGLAYVLAIFAFTVVIRVLILPFNIKAAKSTQGMQKIQPEVKKLQEKYKDDPQKLNAETMKLYKEKNVSVTGGCLPSLLPLPILMALYWVFMGIKGIDGSSFLWIKDLAAPDTLFILPVIAALSTYVPSYLMAKATPSQPNGMNMGTMNLMMAGMMGFMSLKFKSISVLYWIIGNLIQGIQTYFLNYKPAMKEINSTKEKEVQAGEEKFVMAVEEPKNLASKKRKKNK
jgi:YidC/Oxa1 family membrane protein insertase